MKPSELYEALHALIAERAPLHTWGACGVGNPHAGDISRIAYEVGDLMRHRYPTNPWTKRAAPQVWPSDKKTAQ